MLPAFTEKEFQEANELQSKEDARINKLHLSISNKRINRDGSNVVIGVSDSVERQRKSGIEDLDGEQNDEHESDNDRELFSGLLGNGDEDALQIKERKRQEKKKLVEQLTVSKQNIQQFIWNPSLIKEDPLKAMALEEKKEKNMPKPMQPEAATVKLQAKLKESLNNTSKNKGATTNRRQRMRSMPVMSVPDANGTDDNGFKLTTTQLTRPQETVKLNESMQRVTEEPSGGNFRVPPDAAPIKVLDNSPLKKEFKSKAELE